MTRGSEYQVGILVIVAIVATSAWLLILKEYKFKTSTYPLYVDFSRVSGIESGADVTIRGVSKGKVAGVDLQRDHVRLKLEIDEDTFIAQDASFILQSDLINPASIRIEQGVSAVALSPESEIKGIEIAGLASVLEGSSSLLDALQVLAQRMDSLTASGRLDRIVAEVEQGSRGLRVWSEEGRLATTRTLDRVERLSATLEELLAENRRPLNEAIENVSRVSVRADSLAGGIETLVSSLTAVSSKLENGEGSLGRALNDEVLYDRLSQAVARLDSLSKDIQENPGRYFHFSIF